MDSFSKWHLSNPNIPITIFVIGDMMQQSEFVIWLEKLLIQSKEVNGNITVGCHGWSHRSWSAWPRDDDGFTKALRNSKQHIIKVVGKAWRPWFRAPAGYIAPWMAEILAAEDFEVDTSVNPSFLTKGKIGDGNNWNDVYTAIHEAGLVERPWLTSRLFGLQFPACGPALFIPLLAFLARRAWFRANKHDFVSEIELSNSEVKVLTVYWHLLDHARINGKWEPPL